jgi:hypothetical protein
MPHIASSIEKRFDAFVARVVATGVAHESDLRGCTDAEIGRLERKYGVSLPRSYRCYLTRMGRGAGRLFTHDHVRASYDDALTLTEQERERRRAYSTAERVEVPSDALIILDRLGDQHLFIRCGRRQDPPVLYYADWDHTVVESHPSVLDWLETWREEAEAAIRDGHYDNQPRGRRR